MKSINHLFHMAPSTNDHHPAIRCALGIGIPLVVLTALGHENLVIYAMLGAFTSVFGRGQTHYPRLIQQLQAGALLLLAILAGEASALWGLPIWALVLIAALISGLGFGVSSFARLRPAGSQFYVFAYSAIAFMQAPAPFSSAVFVATASVALSLVIGVMGWIIPGHRTKLEDNPLPKITVPERRLIAAESGVHFLSVACAGALALLIGFGHSYWAMVAATVPLVGASASHRYTRGMQRMLGTFGGLVLAWIAFTLPLGRWQVIFVIIACQFFVELLVTRNYALSQLFVTPLALLMSEVAHPVVPWTLIQDRGVETIIGTVVGMVLVAIVHNIRERRTEAKAS